MGAGSFAAMTFAEQTIVRVAHKFHHVLPGGRGVACGIFVEDEDGGADRAIFSSAGVHGTFHLFRLNAEPRGQGIAQGDSYGKGLCFIVEP